MSGKEKLWLRVILLEKANEPFTEVTVIVNIVWQNS